MWHRNPQNTKTSLITSDKRYGDLPHHLGKMSRNPTLLLRANDITIHHQIISEKLHDEVQYQPGG